MNHTTPPFNAQARKPRTPPPPTPPDDPADDELPVGKSAPVVPPPQEAKKVNGAAMKRTTEPAAAEAPCDEKCDIELSLPAAPEAGGRESPTAVPAEEGPIADGDKLSVIEQVLASDPAALRAAVEIWPAAITNSGQLTIDLPISDESDEVHPRIQALLIAGYCLQRDKGGFQPADWLSRLRRALKTVRANHLDNKEIRKACDWLLKTGLAHLAPDADGYSAADQHTRELRVRWVQDLLLTFYANAELNGGERTSQRLAGYADLVRRISAITLLPEPAAQAAAPEDVYVPFPTELLPPKVAAMVTKTARSKVVDEAMVALPALTVLAAAIGTTRQVGVKDDWLEYPILWAAVIQESGKRKTPAFTAVTAPLRAAQQAADEVYRKAKAKFERAMRNQGGPTDPTGPTDPHANATTAKKFLIPPEYNHLLTTDATVEAVGKILSTTERGVAIIKDELSDFVGSLNSYKKSGNDASKFMEMFNGGGMKIDRKTAADPLWIPRAAVWISGVIQPAVFWNCFNVHLVDGFVARYLLACPPPAPSDWTDDVVEPAVTEDWNALILRLRTLDFETDEFGEGRKPVVLALDEAAQAEYQKFYAPFCAEMDKVTDAPLRAALAKMPGYCAKFALLDHLVRLAEDETVDVAASREPVRAESVVRAAALTRWFAHEATRIYRMRAEMASPADQEREELLRFIEHKGGRVTARQVANNFRRYNHNSRNAAEDLRELAEAGLGSFQQSRSMDIVGSSSFTLSPRT